MLYTALVRTPKNFIVPSVYDSTKGTVEDFMTVDIPASTLFKATGYTANKMDLSMAETLLRSAELQDYVVAIMNRAYVFLLVSDNPSKPVLRITLEQEDRFTSLWNVYELQEKAQVSVNHDVMDSCSVNYTIVGVPPIPLWDWGKDKLRWHDGK